jgi:Mor family transcriptional regulator
MKDVNVNSKGFKHFLKVEKETELLKKELENPKDLFSNLNLINDDVLMNLSDEDLEKVSNILDKIK